MSDEADLQRHVPRYNGGRCALLDIYLAMEQAVLAFEHQDRGLPAKATPKVVIAMLLDAMDPLWLSLTDEEHAKLDARKQLTDPHPP